jgi:hypothetical protein
MDTTQLAKSLLQLALRSDDEEQFVRSAAATLTHEIQEARKTAVLDWVKEQVPAEELAYCMEAGGDYTCGCCVGVNEAGEQLLVDRAAARLSVKK